PVTMTKRPLGVRCQARSGAGGAGAPAGASPPLGRAGEPRRVRSRSGAARGVRASPSVRRSVRVVKLTLTSLAPATLPMAPLTVRAHSAQSISDTKYSRVAAGVAGRSLMVRGLYHLYT